MSAAASILTVNAGSSSLKFALFEVDPAPRAVLRGGIEDLDEAPHLIARDASGAVIAERRWPAGGGAPFAEIVETLLAFVAPYLGAAGLAAVGHRIVHGGRDQGDPVLVTPDILTELEDLTPLDPLHMPRNLAPLQAMASARPELPQVACFDTAFHRTLPPVAARFALPRAITEAGVRRYGFHGLSYEYVARRLMQVSPTLAKGRVIVAHLGSGASLCALRDGRSIATTTGFSALDGLVMATRCGSLDPGVILYLGRQGHGFDEIEDMLYRRSGLLGVSGISGDIRVLLASDEPSAREAVELFTYRIAGEVGAMASALGGLDGLVFTAGIGERSPAIRKAVCERLAWLGLRMDETANSDGSGRISHEDSPVEVRVVATDEEAMIARHTWATIQGAAPSQDVSP